MDPAEKSRASIDRRPAQRLLSSACQSLLGRKVQTNCRLRTGTFKLLQCRRRALLLLMSAPWFEHLLLRTTISSCRFAVGPKHSYCAYYLSIQNNRLDLHAGFGIHPYTAFLPRHVKRVPLVSGIFIICSASRVIIKGNLRRTRLARYNHYGGHNGLFNLNFN